MPADTKAATFVLEMKKTGSDDPNEIISYTFYVPPEQIDHSSPARLTVYQSVDGSTHIDHMGEGLSTINISGSTGWTFGSVFSHPFAYHSYMLLRKMIDDYYKMCKEGKAERETLTLFISMPDAPDFGSWRVSVRNMTLRRNASQPLLFQYGIQFVCISENMSKFEYATQSETLSKLINKQSATQTQATGISSGANTYGNSGNNSYGARQSAGTTDALQYNGSDIIFPPNVNSSQAMIHNMSVAKETVNTMMKQDWYKATIVAGTTNFSKTNGSSEYLTYGPKINFNRNYDVTDANREKTSAIISQIQRQSQADYMYANNSQTFTYQVFNYTKEELANSIFGSSITPEIKQAFFKANPQLTDEYDNKVKVLRQSKEKLKQTAIRGSANETILNSFDAMNFPRINIIIPKRYMVVNNSLDNSRAKLKS